MGYSDVCLITVSKDEPVFVLPDALKYSKNIKVVLIRHIVISV